MNRWVHRVGAAIGMGFLWTTTWMGAGAIVARIPGYDSDLPFALLFAPFGLVTGILFSAVLGAIESRRGLDRMSRSRVAAWGAVTGLLLSGIFPALRGDWRELVVFAPGLAMASAIAAAASLAMVRRFGIPADIRS